MYSLSFDQGHGRIGPLEPHAPDFPLKKYLPSNSDG